MSTRDSILHRVSIPIPCNADWTEMPGTDRVRHCSVCDQNVYNLSLMTRREAEELIEQMGGKLCAKVYHRPDGGVLTRNCPPGIRAMSQRLGRRVGWMMSAVLGWSPVAAQERPKIPARGSTLVQIEAAEKEGAGVSGTIYDPLGTVIPDTTIELVRALGGAKVEVRSAESG